MIGLLEKIYVSHTGEEIDLSALSFDELQQLNLEEETFFAREIEKKPSFSKEREQFSRRANQQIFQIADWKRRETKQVGNGVRDQTVELLKRVIEKSAAKGGPISFYEAGVGKADAIRQLAGENIAIRGCDIFLSDEARELQKKDTPRLDLVEENLYDALDRIEDRSVDVFYADNVLEHIVSDEFEATCKKIADKIKVKGTAVFIIPNAYVGPSDISKIARPIGSKATGFHFMEQSFEENLKTFHKYGLEPRYLCWRDRDLKTIHCVRDVLALNALKKRAEKYFGKIANARMRRRVFKQMAYEVYVLEKRR